MHRSIPRPNEKRQAQSASQPGPWRSGGIAPQHGLSKSMQTKKDLRGARAVTMRMLGWQRCWPAKRSRPCIAAPCTSASTWIDLFVQKEMITGFTFYHLNYDSVFDLTRLAETRGKTTRIFYFFIKYYNYAPPLGAAFKSSSVSKPVAKSPLNAELNGLDSQEFISKKLKLVATDPSVGEEAAISWGERGFNQIRRSRWYFHSLLYNSWADRSCKTSRGIP